MAKISISDYDARVDELVKKIVAEVRPFADCSPSAKHERVKRAENDLMFFRKTYLPHYFPDPFCKKHKEVDDSFYCWNEPVKVEAFRGFGKTTFLQSGLIHDICYKRTRFCTWASFTQEKAALHLAIPRTEIRVNERIKSDFNIRFTDADAAEEFVFNHGVMAKAYGRKTEPRGDRYMQYRPDLGVLDDFESDQHVRNQQITNDGINWIFSQLVPAMAKKWRIFYLGTPLSRRCVTTELRKNPGIKQITIPAEIDGKAVWQDVFPKKRLDEIRKLVGRTRYMKEYLLRIEDENDPFRESDFKYYSDVSGDVDATGWDVISFLDPSIGEEMHHNGKALVTIGRPQGGDKIHVLDVWLKKSSVEEMILNLYRSYQRFKQDVIAVEINALPLLKDNIDHYSRHFGIKLPIRQVRNIKNKEARIINTLEAPVQRGDILFARDQQETVIEQLLEIMNPAVEDDAADALEGAVATLQRKQLGRIDSVVIA